MSETADIHHQQLELHGRMLSLLTALVDAVKSNIDISDRFEETLSKLDEALSYFRESGILDVSVGILEANSKMLEELTDTTDNVARLFNERAGASSLTGEDPKNIGFTRAQSILIDHITHIIANDNGKTAEEIRAKILLFIIEELGSGISLQKGTRNKRERNFEKFMDFVREEFSLSTVATLMITNTYLVYLGLVTQTKIHQNSSILCQTTESLIGSLVYYEQLVHGRET